MAVQLAPIDTKVRLPAAVVAATARATQMQKEMLEAQQPPAETPPADGAPPPAPAPAPAPPPDDLEHKLRSTEGRLRVAERERQTLSARLAALEQNRQQQPSAPAPEPTIEVKKLLTPEEIEEYGESFLDVVRRQAREEIAAEMFKVQRQITDLGKSVNSVSTAVVVDAREKMKTDLDAALPDWRRINYDEKFTSWLGLQDPLSGYIRHDMLKSAWAANRTQQVLNFFKAFVAEEAAGSPPAPGNGAQPAPANGGTPPARVTLESLAAPGRAGSAAAPPVPADKPIITRQQVTQFYADVAAGRYRGREAEKLENDAAIVLAANEGRIV